LKKIEIFELGGNFLGHVSFMRDSGWDIFFEAVSENFEIFEWGGKFLGQVCFISDSGEKINFGAVLKFFENFRNLRAGGNFWAMLVL